MKKLISLIAIVFTFSVFAGGGWPKKKGEGYFKLGQGMILGNNYYQPNGEVIGVEDGFVPTNYYETYLYGEYGLTNRFTAIGYMPLLARVTKNEVVNANTGAVESEGGSLTSLGDFLFGLKYGIIPNKRVVWSVQLNFKLPTGVPDGGDGDLEGLLQTGDGAFSQMLQTDVSTTFGSFYVSGMLGIRHRGKDYSDDWHTGLEVGWNKDNRFYAILKMRSVISYYNGTALNTGDGTLFANNLEYIAYGPEFHYFFKNNWGVNANISFATRGRNILANPYMGLGISYDLKKKES